MVIDSIEDRTGSSRKVGDDNNTNINNRSRESSVIASEAWQSVLSPVIARSVATWQSALSRSLRGA